MTTLHAGIECGQRSWRLHSWRRPGPGPHWWRRFPGGVATGHSGWAAV